MGLRENVLRLANTTNLSNKDIARKLGCSRRSVRRYAGKWSNRIQSKESKAESIAKILIMDIETSPILTYTWSLWPKYIHHDHIIKDWGMLSWAAKWLFSDTIMSQVVNPWEAKNHSEVTIIKEIWNLLDKADIVIAHNGAKFDVKKLNAKFLSYGFPPPMPYRVIDTKVVASRLFAFSSNSLDFLTKQLIGEGKTETGGFQLWVQCMEGKQNALNKMVEYNRNDVVILEELYVLLRPWINSHPNIGLYIDTTETTCTNCGNQRLSWGGYYYTPAGRYRAFRCNSCGAVGRSRFSSLSKEDRKKLVVSVAR